MSESLFANHDFGPEAFLANRLRDYGTYTFDGDTNPDLRRERARQAIVEFSLATVIIGRRDGKPETFQSYFERIYSQPLRAKAP